MAEIEEAICTLLTNDGAVAALVSARIYPLIVPQEAARPALAYQLISMPTREYAHDGPTGFAGKRVQLTCEGSTYIEAKALVRAVRRRLSGFTGEVSTDSGIVTIWETQVTNETDGYSESAAAPVVRMDVIMYFKEA